jgi:hypothetical protein
MVNTTPTAVALTQPQRHKEFFANAALSPGHVMELLSTGKVQKNTAVTKNLPKLIATEKEYSGGSITDAYATDDTVIVGVFNSGAEVTLRLAAAATAVVVGDRLIPVTGGTVGKIVTATDPVFAMALEAVDNSAGGSEALIRCILL